MIQQIRFPLRSRLFVRNNNIEEEEESTTEFHGLPTYINSKHLTFFSVMSWFCSFCDQSFSRKYNMQRHLISKHRNTGLVTSIHTVPMSSQKCQRFLFEHPFTCMVAGMTGSGKTAWFRSLLQQTSEAIYLSSERIVWCYSQCNLHTRKC